MDRNQAIGLTLIAALLLAYFYWFAPEPQPATPEATAPKKVIVQDTTQAVATVDSTFTQQFGTLAGAFAGEETVTRLETDDVKIALSNRGGVIRELELKHFKTYDQQPLRLISPATDKFSLYTKYQGKPLDLYALYYKVDETKKGDTTVLTYSIQTTGGAAITQTYAIPAHGYEIGYTISVKGLDQQFNAEPLAFQWNDILRPIEKDLQDTRIYSTITYYSDDDGFDELGARSTSAEKETLTEPFKWVAIKEKFFLSALIAKNNFPGGEIETLIDPNDSSVVKQANVKLTIPYTDAATGKAQYKFYVGPNDYNLLGKVTDGFARNVYLGWKPIYWINKFVIFPVFNLLTKFVSNYGLIIIILVILLKLVLAPLSYRSYLSMAKMKVLKPELDEIKERVGDDMAKVQQEQLKLYQQVGVNPISGCVPVLLQMPLIFAMFYLFPASIELRQQPFLWAEDLSTYDSIVRLPFAVPFLGSHISLFTLLMTASTLIYTWQNNQISSVTGPMKSMSYIMPLIFFFVLNSFSAGLTFYYLISNLGTFAQQAIIRRFVDDDKIKKILEENRKKNAAGGTGTKSKFMSKLQDAMKASEEARKKADEQRRKPKKS